MRQYFLQWGRIASMPFSYLIILSIISFAISTYLTVQNPASFFPQTSQEIAPSTSPTVVVLPTQTPSVEVTPTPTPSPSIQPTSTPKLPQKTNQYYSGYKRVIATVFWIGESADETNDYIPNDKSAWDVDWIDNYGGVDNPNDRCEFFPCEFTPQENPFYIALPYNDLTDDGKRKDSAQKIPWFNKKSDLKSVLKNAWIELQYQGTLCYAQWEDVGPFESDDFEYVFGEAPPRNAFGVSAGIDISPAVYSCLNLQGNKEVEWRFVDETAVPNGPWKKKVTTSHVNW